MTREAPASSQQGGTGLGLAARPELDDVAAGQTVAAVKFREPARRPVGNKIRAELPGRVAEAAPDNLFDAALVQVDAGTKHAKK
jgi:hypothetical protein